MSDWNAALYDRFADERSRPSRDLLAQVPLTAPRRVVDLGCGSGLSTELLVARYPEAEHHGLDTSPAMLKAAAERLPSVRFTLGDVSTYQAEPPASLLFANAVFQWVPNHRALLPHLMRQLEPGGVLAYQMPDNLAEPSQALMRAVAAEPRYHTLLKDAAGARTALLTEQETYDLFQGEAREVVQWSTRYIHVLAGPEAIVEMVSSTGLKPFTDPLPPAERAAYMADYTARITEAYPRQADGRVLLPFPRRFVVAIR